VEFYAVDTLSGKILDRVYPTSWSLEDPLHTPGTGELVIPKPSAARRETVREMLQPRRRWIAARDEATRVWVWGGPIPRRPTLGDSTITVPLGDWRSWFYRAPLRPPVSGSGNYAVKNRDQIVIAREVVRRALDDTGVGETSLRVPPMRVDGTPLSGVLRERTLTRLGESVGTTLEGLTGIERGIDWWTYVTPSLTDPTVLKVHVAFAYPERTYRTDPVKLEWRLGVGGNVAEPPSWPAAEEEFTRVWVTGDGEPPAQVYAYDESTEVDVLWEHVHAASGVKRQKRAWEHAYGQRLKSQQYAAAAEFSVTAERVPFGDVFPGDRARVIYDDGWESVDVPAARIVSRVMSGGAEEPTLHRLVVNLADSIEPTSGTPGEAGEDEGA
jgi:hypothetical protein